MSEDSEPADPADGSELSLEPDFRTASAPDDRGGLPLVAPDGDGLRWSFELDLVSALEAIGQPLRDWDGVDQEEDLAAEMAALGFTDVPPDAPDLGDRLPPVAADRSAEPDAVPPEPDAAADRPGLAARAPRPGRGA